MLRIGNTSAGSFPSCWSAVMHGSFVMESNGQLFEEDEREHQLARSDEVESALEQLRYNISLID